MAGTRSDWATSLLLQTGLPSHQPITHHQSVKMAAASACRFLLFLEQAVPGNGDQLTPGSADRAGRY